MKQRRIIDAKGNQRSPNPCARCLAAYAGDRFEDEHGTCKFPSDPSDPISTAGFTVNGKSYTKCARYLQSGQNYFEVGHFGAF